MEGAGLSVILFVAALATAAVSNGLRGAGPVVQRMIEAAFVALTIVGTTYSPWGRRSGAHYNPAVTLTFLVLGRIRPADTLGYVGAQLIGAVLGLQAASLVAGAALRAPPVFWIVTRPGHAGPLAAVIGEGGTAFILMSVVLAFGAIRAVMPFVGLIAAGIVFASISFEAPLSGSSLNPARSMASALSASAWSGYWIYLAAPTVGMIAAAVVNRSVPALPCSGCAKVQISKRQRCIHCGFDPGNDRALLCQFAAGRRGSAPSQDVPKG